jgi:hypothetical protein
MSGSILEWSRWPLGLSLVLHAALFAAGWPRPRAAEGPARNDFWAGRTFEAPDLVEDSPPESETAWTVGAPAGEVPSRAESTPEPAHAAPRTRSAPQRPSASKAAGQPSPTATGSQSRESGSENSGFGAEDAAPGVRDLLRSFVRAIPAAASSDPDWATVPIGPAGSAELTLVLDADAKPHADSIDPHVPPPLRRLIQKTLLVLSGGRFAIASEGPATERLRIVASVTQLAVPPAADGQSGGVFGLGFEPPNDQRVSRAFFTLASGRHVEVTVRPSRPR